MSDIESPDTSLCAARKKLREVILQDIEEAPERIASIRGSIASDTRAVWMLEASARSSTDLLVAAELIHRIAHLQ